MDLLSRIRQVSDNMTPTDKKIAQAVLNNPDDFARLETAAISGVYGFSQPALTRFAKRIGYSGYAEFKYDIARNKNILADHNDDSLASETARLLVKTEEMFPEQAMMDIVDVLNRAERIFVTGYHRSRASADLLNSALINFRYPSQAIAYDEVFKMDAFCRKTDLLIVFSVSSSIYKDLIKNISESDSKPETMLITSSKKHDLARYFDHVIVLPDGKAIQASYSMDPAITNLFFINLLSMYLTKQD